MMQTQDTIAITGAAGFIGSVLAGELNNKGYEHLILVDDFSNEKKADNLLHKKFEAKVHREQFFEWMKQHPGKVNYVFHLGARTDTTEMDYAVHKKWNLDYSKDLWDICTEQKIPLVYASSAATYGNGELGYKDDHNLSGDLHPLNPYGVSKNEFDIWAIQQKKTPPCWYGVKFFNVYGPNEYHKDRMASVVLHAYKQILAKGSVKLFRSHHPDFRDGEQLRDFIYVKDIISIICWLMEEQPESGLYNAGTGQARSFLDLVRAIFKTLDLPENVQFIDTPADIRDKYQYYTEADMQKIRDAGFLHAFYSIEEGIRDYVENYLTSTSYH